MQKMQKNPPGLGLKKTDFFQPCRDVIFKEYTYMSGVTRRDRVRNVEIRRKLGFKET